MDTTNKRYLGDGVYVQVQDGMLRLTTSDGIATTQEIWLEPEVFIRLQEYWNSLVSKE